MPVDMGCGALVSAFKISFLACSRAGLDLYSLPCGFLLLIIETMHWGVVVVSY